MLGSNANRSGDNGKNRPAVEGWQRDLRSLFHTKLVPARSVVVLLIGCLAPVAMATVGLRGIHGLALCRFVWEQQTERGALRVHRRDGNKQDDR